MIWATVSSRSCFCWLYSFSIFGYKECNQSDFGIDHLVMSMCRVVSWFVGLFAMTSVFSWQNSVSLCLVSFCIPRPNLPVTPGISWLPAFAFLSPMMKRTSFLVLVLGLVGLHRTVQLQLLRHQWLGIHTLGLLWYWVVCLGNKSHVYPFKEQLHSPYYLPQEINLHAI